MKTPIFWKGKRVGEIEQRNGLVFLWILDKKFANKLATLLFFDKPCHTLSATMKVKGYEWVASSDTMTDIDVENGITNMEFAEFVVGHKFSTIDGGGGGDGIPSGNLSLVQSDPDTREEKVPTVEDFHRALNKDFHRVLNKHHLDYYPTGKDDPIK